MATVFKLPFYLSLVNPLSDHQSLPGLLTKVTIWWFPTQRVSGSSRCSRVDNNNKTNGLTSSSSLLLSCFVSLKRIVQEIRAATNVHDNVLRSCLSKSIHRTCPVHHTATADSSPLSHFLLKKQYYSECDCSHGRSQWSAKSWRQTLEYEQDWNTEFIRYRDGCDILTKFEDKDTNHFEKLKTSNNILLTNSGGGSSCLMPIHALFKSMFTWSSFHSLGECVQTVVYRLMCLGAY